MREKKNKIEKLADIVYSYVYYFQTMDEFQSVKSSSSLR